MLSLGAFKKKVKSGKMRNFLAGFARHDLKELDLSRQIIFDYITKIFLHSARLVFYLYFGRN